MSENKEIEKQVKELSDLRDQASKLIEQYNLLAKKVDFKSRLAVLSSTFYGDDYDDEDDGGEEKDTRAINEKVEDSGYYDLCGLGVQAPGESYCWFPSSIC